MVKYCNAACKKKHRSKHKKQCEKRVAELHDEKLFKQPPLREECPICMLPMPEMESGRRYNACCGKLICSGCFYANVMMMKGADICPFCRTSSSGTDREMRKQLENLVKKNDAIAIFNLGCGYNRGKYGCPQNRAKALELWHHAGELGSTDSYFNIGMAYYDGRGVGLDEKKARHYYELAAIGGDAKARYTLAILETKAGNMGRALNHYMISVKGGFAKPLLAIKDLYMAGYATKEDYSNALQAHQEYLGEVKSIQRDDAAAHDSDQYKYY